MTPLFSFNTLRKALQNINGRNTSFSNSSQYDKFLELKAKYSIAFLNCRDAILYLNDKEIGHIMKYIYVSNNKVINLELFNIVNKIKQQNNSAILTSFKCKKITETAKTFTKIIMGFSNGITCIEFTPC